MDDGRPGISNEGIVVGIPTAGRSDVIIQLLSALGTQTLLPHKILICGTSEQDLAGLPESDAVIRFSAPAGLPRQRNAILDRLEGDGVLVFFDDDFIPAPGYLAAIATVFAGHPEVIAATGSLIADGSRTAGYSGAEAAAMIEADAAPGVDAGWTAVPHSYGCNMAFRMGEARRHGLRFDERLPLYAWSEDMDFSHRIGRFGTIAAVAGARGVHLGVKHGRTSGYRLGYSQVANPVYLYGKGSYTLSRASRSVGRNVVMNLARAAWPEPHVDRLGRLRGNVLAAFDMLRGRLAPERILDL